MFTALVVAGCIGLAALLNSLIADPVERLRRRLRTAPPPAQAEAALEAARRKAPRQRAAASTAVGTIRRAP